MGSDISPLLLVHIDPWTNGTDGESDLQIWDDAQEHAAVANDKNAVPDSEPLGEVAEAGSAAPTTEGAEPDTSDALAMVASLKPGMDIADIDDEALMDMLE